MTRPLPQRPSQTPATGDVQADAALVDQEMLDDANTVAAGGAPSTLTPAQQATANDDWARVATWDVTDAAGRPVATLDQLAEVLGTDRTTAASALLNSPMGAAAPPELSAEATEEVNPSGASLYGEFDDVLPDQAAAGFDAEDDEGKNPDEFDEEDPDADGDTEGGPDDLDAEEDAEDESDDDKPAFLKGKKSLPRVGSLVRWGGNLRGRIELLVTDGGTVPGVTEGLVGTKDLPVARVRLYEHDQKTGHWVRTDRRTAVDARALSPLGSRGPEAVVPLGQRDTSARLVLKVAQHAGPAGTGKPAADAIREVYRRGRESWPGESKTLLSAEEWALGRVDAFVEKAEGYDVDHYVGDDDLLP